MCHPFPVSAAAVIAIILGLLLVAALAAIGVLVQQLNQSRADTAELREALNSEQETPRGPRTVQAAQAAGLAMRTVVETASRMREQGVRGMLLSSIDDLAAWAMEDRNEIARIAAPDGTVTMMFSDIENSTSVNSEIGDEQWVKLLQAHDRLLHTYVDKHRGHVVKSQGDGYMVVFPTPELALGASLGIQRALSAKRQRSRRLRRTPIRVRIGLHTGTAIEREGDYFGRNVAMAARVASMADGGEIMVTREIAEALSDATDFRFVEDETVELKGLPGEHQLWLVEAA
ncbi:MAG: adenylate/guanylate cyclase protein [Marmoricola sp.]|nr:adenylate/guanylate cyclase protein [Marmoricola sp.]